MYRNIFAHVQYSFAVFSKNMRNKLAVSVDYKGNRLLPIEKYYFGQNIDIFIFSTCACVVEFLDFLEKY